MLAQAYGAQGVKLASHRELGPALGSALKANAPVLIEVPLPVLIPPFQIPPHGAIPRPA